MISSKIKKVLFRTAIQSIVITFFYVFVMTKFVGWSILTNMYVIDQISWKILKYPNLTTKVRLDNIENFILQKEFNINKDLYEKNVANITILDSIIQSSISKDSVLSTFLKRYSTDNHFTCGEISILYANIFQQMGFKVRVYQLYKSIFSTYDTHVLLELYDESDNRWIAMDPTFQTNSKFIWQNKILSVNQVKQNILKSENFLKLRGISNDEYNQYWNYIAIFNYVNSTTSIKGKILRLINPRINYLVQYSNFTDDRSFQLHNVLIIIILIIPLFILIINFIALYYK